MDFSSRDVRQKTVSVWPVLLRTYWKNFIGIFLLGIAHYTLTFVNPHALKLLVNHVDNLDEEDWKGYFYSAVLFGSSIVWTVTFHLYNQELSITSLQMRSSVVSMVYRKSLRLSNRARRKFTVGEITNLMSIDAQRIVETFPYMNHVWTAPYTIGLALYFLYLELDLAALAGLGALLLIIPVNIWAMQVGLKLQKDQLEKKDARMKLMNEILAGIKVLKLYAWEIPFMKRISDIRNKEISNLRKNAKVMAVSNSTFSISPVIVTLASFGVYVLIDPTRVLTADTIFVCLSLFNIMRIPLTLFPWALIESIKLFVSFNRINKFLNAEELSDCIRDMDADSTCSVSLDRASFSWDDISAESSSLEDLSLNVPKGSLVAVVGMVGAGKSSLVSALLGEMEMVSGSASREANVAYVPQQAWIQNMSLKNNVLFEKPYTEGKFKRVLKACALESDLDILASAEDTEIGENGINLSGGQKQRVSLARAVYSDADLYLMDDPLSAVDAHVGKHIFDNVISSRTGMLRDKTRVLVTHSVSFLKEVDQIMVMKNGKIAEVGSYEALMEKAGAFAEFLVTYGNESVEEEGQENDFKLVPPPFDPSGSSASPVGSLPAAKRERSLSITSYDSTLSSMEGARIASLGDGDKPDSLAPVEERDGALIEEEKATVGKVRWSIYGNYFKSMGVPIFVFCVVLYVVGQSVHAINNYWLSMWADDNDAHPEDAQENSKKYLSVYGMLGLVEVVVEFSREFIHYLNCARASDHIHVVLLLGVMRSPMSFFDTTPNGRIVNRFSADVNTIDQTIPNQINDFIWSLCDVIAVLVMISVATPMFVTVIIPLLIIYYFVQKFYIATSRQLKRLESISKSPIFAHFSETVQGASSIRAYRENNRFIGESEDRVFANVKSFYLSVSSNRWLGVRVELLGNLIVLFASLFAVIGRETLSPGLAGLSINYALSIIDTLNWMVRMACDLETNAVAIERVVEYSHNSPEADWEKKETDKLVDEDWPDKGVVKFHDYRTRYRDGLELVLNGIDLEVRSLEKVGLCGRTGAGKSSLTLALFRIIEPAGGRIEIDGVDVSTLGLHRLRSGLTIIPQDPVLFTGDLRFNLDPTGLHSDAELWTSLEHAYLKEFVAGLPDGLDHEVNEGGENLSVGQRQLICLARALLRKTKILVLDEATAAVDLETDDLIQATIRREFADCTILTIAHRLNTIMDSDRIAVFKEGRLVELDTPSHLLRRTDSVFRDMARNANLL